MGYERSLCGQHILNKGKGGGEGGAEKQQSQIRVGGLQFTGLTGGDLLSVLTVDFYTFTLSQ